MAAGDISLNRGGLFKFGNFENRKGAAKPRPLCTPLGLFLSSARDSLFLFVDLCLYASVFSALRCADVVLFLHFLSDSLLARCLYSSIFNALRVAISRFESQARGGRLLVVTLSEPPSSSRGRSVSQPAACLPSPSLHQPKYHSHHYLPAIQRSADGPKPPEQPPQSLTTGAATLSHNITTFTPSDTTPKHPPYKPQAAHKPPAAAQPVSWNSRPYKPRSTPYSAPYQ